MDQINKYKPSAKTPAVQLLTISNVPSDLLEAIDELAARQDAVAQVSFGASWNAPLPSTRRRKRLVNRDENRDFCFFVDALSGAIFLNWRG